MLKNSQENICVEVSFFNKVEDLKKETPALVFFCDLCEIFKNTFFTELPLYFQENNLLWYWGTTFKQRYVNHLKFFNYRN